MPHKWVEEEERAEKERPQESVGETKHPISPVAAMHTYIYPNDVCKCVCVWYSCRNEEMDGFPWPTTSGGCFKLHCSLVATHQHS